MSFHVSILYSTVAIVFLLAANMQIVLIYFILNISLNVDRAYSVTVYYNISYIYWLQLLCDSSD